MSNNIEVDTSMQESSWELGVLNWHINETKTQLMKVFWASLNERKLEEFEEEINIFLEKNNSDKWFIKNILDFSKEYGIDDWITLLKLVNNWMLNIKCVHYLFCTKNSPWVESFNLLEAINYNFEKAKINKLIFEKNSDGNSDSNTVIKEEDSWIISNIWKDERKKVFDKFDRISSNMVFEYLWRIRGNKWDEIFKNEDCKIPWLAQCRWTLIFNTLTNKYFVFHSSMWLERDIATKIAKLWKGPKKAIVIGIFSGKEEAEILVNDFNIPTDMIQLKDAYTHLNVIYNNEAKQIEFIYASKDEEWNNRFNLWKYNISSRFQESSNSLVA